MATVVDSQKFNSTRADSTAIYTAVLYDDGTASCDCPGWRFKRAGAERGCRHTGIMLTGRAVKVVTAAEMARMAVRGEQYDIIKRWTNGVTGNQMVTLRLTGSPRDRNSAREQFKPKQSPFEQGRNDGLDRIEKRKQEQRDEDAMRRIMKEDRVPDPLAARDFFPPKPKPQVTRRAEQIEPPARAPLVFDEEV